MDPVVVTMATMASRAEHLRRSLDSLLGQGAPAFLIQVYLNDFDEVPSWFATLPATVIPLLGREHAGDLKASAKFHYSDELAELLAAGAYHFTCDDDIIYPVNYVERMVERIEYYERTSIVCTFGARFVSPHTSYYRQRTSLRLNVDLDDDVVIHGIGTGTMAYHSQTIRFTRCDFDVPPNLEDLFVAVAAKRAGVPAVCVRRPANWLEVIPVHGFSCFGRFQETGEESIPTAIVQREAPWPVLPELPRSIRNRINAAWRAAVAPAEPAPGSA